MKFKLKEKSDFKAGAKSSDGYEIRILQSLSSPMMHIYNPAGVPVSLESVFNTRAFSKFNRTPSEALDLLWDFYFKNGQDGIMEFLKLYAYGTWKPLQY